MTRPDGKAETLGLQILDEPAAKQSDPTGIEFGKQYIFIKNRLYKRDEYN